MDAITLNRERPGWLMAIAAVLLVALPAAAGALDADAPGTARASPAALNLFVNAEMEACAPHEARVGADGRTACPPWLLRAASPADDDPGAASRARPLYAEGHGSTTSLRVTYDARDGDVYLGQRFGPDGNVTATPWRAPKQVTFDYRASGAAGLGVVADARYPDGSRALVSADPAPLTVASATGWERVTFTFHDLGKAAGERAAVTGLWIVVHDGFTKDGVRVDVDNVYASHAYVEPYVEVPPIGE